MNQKIIISDYASVYMDVLRAISAQLVVIGHAYVFSGKKNSLNFIQFPPIESVAVVIFFILSGFLISLSVYNNKIRSSHYSFSEYFSARFLRIYIVLIPAVIFVGLVDGWMIYFYEGYKYFFSLNLKTAIGNLLMLQKNPINMLPMFGSASTWWTLSIEWWLYLFFGWCMLSKLSGVRFWTIAVAFGVFPLFYSILGFGAGLPLVWFFSAQLVYVVNKTKSVKNLLGFGFLFIILSMMRYVFTDNAYDLTAMFLMTCSFFCFFQFFNCKKDVLQSNFVSLIKFMAAYSYTLYLIHFTLMEAMNLIWPEGEFFVTLILVSNFLAIPIAYLTEMKLNSFKKYIYKHRNYEK